MNRRMFLTATLAALPLSVSWAHNGIDHDAHHGGVVVPHKAIHFEAVALPAGGVQLYFSDKSGEPMPASTVKQVAAEIEYSGGKTETVDMAIDPTGVFWAGKSAPLTDAKAMLRVGFSFESAPVILEVSGAALIAAAKKPKKTADKKIADQRP